MVYRARALPRPFWQLTAARSLATFASNMLAIIVGWTIYRETHSTLALGFAGLAEAVPAIGLAMWAGLLVDRGDPLALYRRTQAAQLLVVALPLGGLLFASELPHGALISLLYGASIVAGATRALFQPCLYAIMPRLVSRPLLPVAASFSGAAMQVARVLGPGLGGLLYGAFGAEVSLLLAGLCIVASLVALSGLTLPARTAVAAAPAPISRGSELLEGLRYVFGQPILLSALSLDMICVLFGGATAVLPAFAEEVLLVGPSALGWLRAAPAMGAVLGSLALAYIDIRPVAGKALLLAVAGYGGAMLSFALSRSLACSLVLLFASGLLDSVSVLVRQLIVQLMSPENLRGRISAVNSMFIGSSNELGEFESGTAAWWLGLVPSVLCGSSICLAFVAAMALCNGRLRRLDLRTAVPS